MLSTNSVFVKAVPTTGCGFLLIKDLVKNQGNWEEVLLLLPSYLILKWIHGERNPWGRRLGSFPWCLTQFHRQIPHVKDDSRALSHPEMMGTALVKQQSVLVMLWNLRKLTSLQLRVALALTVDSPLVMISCIPDHITTMITLLPGIYCSAL